MATVVAGRFMAAARRMIGTMDFELVERVAAQRQRTEPRERGNGDRPGRRRIHGK
jgi:hypothetical protein